MIDYNCRYCSPEGECITQNKLCNGCYTRPHASYNSQYDFTRGTTTIKILHEGRCYMSAEIYGQLTAAAVAAYARDMTKMLIEKGVL